MSAHNPIEQKEEVRLQVEFLQKFMERKSPPLTPPCVLLQTFLQQTSKARGPSWMGLSDLRNEATWHWVDGSPLSPR